MPTGKCERIYTPFVASDGTYIPDVHNRPIRVYRIIHNRLIPEDLYAKPALFQQRHGA